MYSLTFVPASLGLAAGAKISTILGASILGGVFLWQRRSDWRLPHRWLLLGLGTVLAAIFCSRYVANVFVYGDPFFRIEHATGDLDSLVGNLTLLLERSFQFFRDSPNEPMKSWALSGGLGLAGPIVVASLAISVLRRNLTVAATVLMVSTIGALLVSAYLIPARPYGLRFFLPFMLVIAVCALSGLELPQMLRRIAPTAFASLSAVNLLFCLVPGEIVPPPDIDSAIRTARSMTPLERATLPYPWTLAGARVRELGLDTDYRNTIAIVANLDRPILPFVGSRSQNRLIFANSVEALGEALTSRPDYLAILDGKGSQRTGHDDDYPGYLWVSDLYGFRIAVRDDLYDLREIALTGPWSTYGTAHFDTAPLSVRSETAVDAALVSPPIPFAGLLLVRAELTVDVESPSGTAAHLSLHGRSPIISIPSGRNLNIVVSSLVQLPEPNLHLSFGLGGWSTGAGTVTLRRLAIFQMDRRPPRNAAVPFSQSTIDTSPL